MKNLCIFLFFLPFVFLFANRAYAYLDPGTGSMLLQGLIAGIMAVATVTGIFWSRVRAFFSRFGHRREDREGSRKS